MNEGAPLGERATRFARPAGDAAALTRALLAVPGVDDVIVTEAHVAVLHAPGGAPAGVTAVLAAPGDATPAAPAATHVIRVRYDGEDLAEAAAALRLPPAALVAQHAALACRVQLVGFLPGFAYLGPLPEALRLPRRAAPRARVPALSLAIAGPYTGIYPSVSPGGWWLLGHALDFTPLGASGPTLRLGDAVRFEVVP